MKWLWSNRSACIFGMLFGVIAFWLFSVTSVTDLEYTYDVSGDQSMVGVIRHVKYWGTDYQDIEVRATEDGQRIYKTIRRGGKARLRIGDGRLEIISADAGTTEHLRLPMAPHHLKAHDDMVEAAPLPSHWSLRTHNDGLTLEPVDEAGFRVIEDATGAVLFESREVPILCNGGFSIAALNRDFSGSLNVYNGKTGRQEHSVVLPRMHNRPLYLADKRLVLCKLREGEALWLYGVDGSKSLLYRNPHRLWSLWIGLAFISSVATWAAWIFGSWNTTPFTELLIGIAALHLLVFAAVFGASVRNAGLGVSNGSFYITGVLASATSILLLLCPLRHMMRFAHLVLTGISVLLLMQATRLFNEDNRLESVCVLTLQILVQLVIVWSARRVGVVLVHGNEDVAAPRQRRLSIGDLLVCTLLVAAGCAYWMAFNNKDVGPAFRHFSGSTLALATAMILVVLMSLPRIDSWLEAVKRVVPQMVIGAISLLCYIVVATAMSDRHSRLTITVAIPLVAGSAILLRLHGYRFKRPSKSSAAAALDQRAPEERDSGGQPSVE